MTAPYPERGWVGGSWARGSWAFSPSPRLPLARTRDDGDFKMDYKNYNSGSAAPEAESDLVKRLRAKSEENKEKNDKERFNYDKQYSANLAIIKGTGYVPDNEKDRERLGITRPAECDLPFFKDSPTCKKF